MNGFTLPAVVQRDLPPHVRSLPWEFQGDAPFRKRVGFGSSDFSRWWVMVFTEISTSGWQPMPEAHSWRAVAGSGEPFINLTMRSDPPIPFWMPEAYPDTVRKPTKEEVAATTIDRFLEEVYSLGQISDIPSATDKIFDHIDKLLCDGYFRVCEEILKRAEPRRLPSSLRRSFLTITAAAKDKLPARASFYKESLQLLSQEKGEEQAKKLLSRLA